MNYDERVSTWRSVAEHYIRFENFLNDTMFSVLGFNTSRLQKDIAKTIAYSTDDIMIQAQRGEAKTTISAIYCVWALMHNPKLRIIIFSAGEDMASEIATLIHKIIMTVDFLEFLRPDRSLGHRTSALKFDIHHDLKGVDKSPSVTCLGITSQMQGKRADLIIADDIESKKNAQTDTMRSKLVDGMDDFVSIIGNNTNGRIIYLGTPQSGDSVYNSLDSKGFRVVIYPARYPTPEQADTYNNNIAPILLQDLKDNPSLGSGGGILCNQGQPTDPDMFDELALQNKELKQGQTGYRLQQMLDTSLLDKDRYPLKISDLLFMDLPTIHGEYKNVNSIIAYGTSALFVPPIGFAIDKARLAAPVHVSDDMSDYVGIHAYIDPSGGGANGDETGWAVTASVNGYIFVLGCGGIPGGSSDASLNELAQTIASYKPNQITCETNYGGDMFVKIFTPYLAKYKHSCTIISDFSTGQKELRIIDTLEPLISTHRLICNTNIIASDIASSTKYGVRDRNIYSLFFQMAKITRTRGALKHDDRLDALAGSCQYWVDLMDTDSTVELAEKHKNEFMKLIAEDNPLYFEDTATTGSFIQGYL